MRETMAKLSELKTYPQELGICLHKEQDRFKWFLASILFAKRISAEVAKRTYKEFEKHGIVTAEAISQAGWDKLVEVLDAGGYVRYDFSTASNLLAIANALMEKYGSLEALYDQSKDSKDLEKRLLGFKGVGPTTVNIFLRELRGIWEKAQPQPSPLAIEVASKLRLDTKELTIAEPVLVKLNLESCKHKGCSSCLVGSECQQAAIHPLQAP